MKQEVNMRCGKFLRAQGLDDLEADIVSNKSRDQIMRTSFTMSEKELMLVTYI
jgi:hypothetical protein